MEIVYIEAGGFTVRGHRGNYFKRSSIRGSESFGYTFPIVGEKINAYNIIKGCEN